LAQQQWQFVALPPNSTTISQLTPSVLNPTLQNQLYRVEIHQPCATAVVTSITSNDNSQQITLQPTVANGQPNYQVNDTLQIIPASLLATQTVPDTVVIASINSDGSIVASATSLNADMVMNTFRCHSTD